MEGPFTNHFAVLIISFLLLTPLMVLLVAKQTRKDMLAMTVTAISMSLFGVGVPYCNGWPIMIDLVGLAFMIVWFLNSVFVVANTRRDRKSSSTYADRIHSLPLAARQFILFVCCYSAFLLLTLQFRFIETQWPILIAWFATAIYLTVLAAAHKETEPVNGN